MAGGGAVIVLGIIGALVLGVFGPSAPPVGEEIARHTHEGRTYILVEYGDELAIFSAASGAPVTQRGLAEDILRSYAWRQVLADFDAARLRDVSAKIERIDDGVSDARGLSNDVVYIFDELDGMKASIPFVGSISAMDVVRESFSGVEEAEGLIRSLDSELNALGSGAASLTGATERIRGVEPSSVSGDEMDALFADAAEAATDLEASARAVKDFVSDATQAAGNLERALNAGSDTPAIGGALGDFARRAGRFESVLSGLSDLLGGFESELGSLSDDMKDTRDSANDAFQDYMRRWLAEPYDAEWPPADPERRPAAGFLQDTADADGEQSPPALAAAPAPAPTAAPTRTPASAPAAAPAPAPDVTKPSVSVPLTDQSTVSGRQPFKLEWEVSESSVEAGEGFILTVRMYDVGRSGEHGGISVSFPSLSQSGGPEDWYSTPAADVEAVDYTSGLSNVTFHHPGATIYHRQGNRQFPADYLLVESDDPSWSSSSDRTLDLLIVPKHSGEFPIQIRGWLCGDGYESCSRNPDSGTATDQQGHAVEMEKVSVAATPAHAAPTAAAAPSPEPTPTPSVEKFASVSAGGGYTCGVRSDGSGACWGQLVSMPLGGEFASVSAGVFHMCGLRSDGSVACWGEELAGQSTPPSGEFASVSVGLHHTCGLRLDGTVSCWGYDESGESTPPGGEFTSVSAGFHHTCGLRLDGTVSCWGSYSHGRSTPPGGEFVSISAGAAHTCGVRLDGTVSCWGSDDYGKSRPPGGKFASVSAGSRHTCGLRLDGTVSCWGLVVSTPPGGEFTSISAGGAFTAGHTCGLRVDGSVVCWGSNSSGQSTPPGE